MVVPCVKVLKTTLDDLSKKFTSKLVMTLKASVSTRQSKYQDYVVYLVASVLDLIFILKWCSPDKCNGNCGSVKKKFKHLQQVWLLH